MSEDMKEQLSREPMGTCVEGKKEKPLFSIIILTYMQQHLIEKAIDSILEQAYPNIELIICDDCSADFDAGAIGAYIEEHKTRALKNYVIFQQSENVGTTLNACKGVELSHGEYFKFHAGDDMLYGEGVLGRIAEYFENQEIQIIAARAVACTYDGAMTSDYYPSYQAVMKMMDASAEEQFTLMATQSWGEYVNAPAVFWRRSFYDKIGGLDLSYCYTEDWPMWLKITMAGYRIFAINDVTTIYRYGGISNSRSTTNGTLGRAHYRECIRMLEEYGIPFFEKNGDKTALRRCKQSVAAIQARICMETEWPDMTLGEKITWKWKNRRLLLTSWLDRKQLHGGVRAVNRNCVIAIIASLLLYVFSVELIPEVKGNLFWAWIFFTLLVLASLRVIGAMLLKIIFWYRRKRNV